MNSTKDKINSKRKISQLSLLGKKIYKNKSKMILIL
jgi:hypothetical protein